MKKFITITLLLLSFSAFAQDGGSDQIKLKTSYLQLDNLQEISPITIKILIADESGLIGYMSNVSGTVSSVNGQTGDVVLNVTDLVSTGAGMDQVPVANGSGGISWQTLTGGGVSLWNSTNGYITYDKSYGDVRIGEPTDTLRLYVSGKIYTTEVFVRTSVPAPDYVFEKGYQLTQLDELESYLEENKHLPEIPSAKEIEADGINLSEMNMLLLKKVEELTLYLIDLQKTNTAQDKRIRELERRTPNP